MEAPGHGAAGTYHHVGRKHAQGYLASVDRRYQRGTMTGRLMWAALQAEPWPCRVIIAG